MGVLQGELVLYTKDGCHLCSEAEALVGRLAARAGRPVRRVEIGGDAEARLRYAQRVPVLTCGGRELCWGRFDPVVLAALLGVAATPPVRLWPRRR
jgi:hypothetical protein